MKSGTVKMWDASRGFGFITLDEDDEDVFVNVNDLMGNLRSIGLREGQQVKFDIRSDMKGEKAVNVRVK